jgi:hypothetical protein
MKPRATTRVRDAARIAAILPVLAAGSIAAQDARSIPADDVVRIGDGGAGGVLFERIEAVEVGDDGRVYVLDGLAHTLTAFEPTGRRAWTVGREGEGPGEFAAPVGLAWAPDGRLWIVDPENQRVTPVDRAGSIEPSRRLPAGFVLSPWPGRFDRAGRFYSYLESAGGEYDYVMAAFDDDLRQVDALVPPAPPEPGAFFAGTTPRGSDLRARVPFTPRLVWRLDGEGRFVSAWTASARFEGPFGTLEGDVPAEGPTVSTAERDAAIDGLSRFVQMGGRVDASRIPRRKPALRTFVLDDRDRIWAVLSPGAGAAGVSVVVLDPATGASRSIEVPVRLAAVPTPVVRGRWLVGVERDALGLETVVRVDLGPDPERAPGPGR